MRIKRQHPIPDYEKKGVSGEHPMIEYWDIPDNEISFTGGTEGIFATWEDGEGFIHFANGNDGFWREMACHHKHWIRGIIENPEDRL